MRIKHEGFCLKAEKKKPDSLDNIQIYIQSTRPDRS